MTCRIELIQVKREELEKGKNKVVIGFIKIGFSKILKNIIALKDVADHLKSKILI